MYLYGFKKVWLHCVVALKDAQPLQMVGHFSSRITAVIASLFNWIS